MENVQWAISNRVQASEGYSKLKAKGSENEALRMENYSANRRSNSSKLRAVCVGALIILLAYNTITTSFLLFAERHVYNADNYISHDLEDETPILNELRLAASERDEGDNNDSVPLFSDLLVLQSRNQLFTFDPKTNASAMIHESESAIYDVEVYNDTIFTSEFFPTRIRRVDRSSRPNGTDCQVSTSFEDPRVRPKGLAVDHSTGNLYFVDETMGALIVVNVSTGEFTLLTTSIARPRKIFLDMEFAMAFVLSGSNEVLRIVMDVGYSYKQTIIGSNVHDMTLDRKAKRIYAIENDVNIVRSDYEGNNRKILFISTEKVASVTTFDGRLYWLWRKSGNESATLPSCLIDENDCSGNVRQTLPGDPIAIKAQPYLNRVYDSCQWQGCPSFCLVSKDLMACCVCPLGYRINYDGKENCKKVEDFVLYAQGNKFRTLDPYSNKTTDVLWPTPFKNETFLYQDLFDFDYDLRNDDLYLSYETHIDKIKLKAYEKQTTVLTSTRADFIFGHIAYDWSTGNLYYVRRSKISSFPHSIMVFNPKLGPEYQKTLAKFSYNATTLNDGSPSGLVLDPSRNHLLYVVGSGDHYMLKMRTMKGENLADLIDNNGLENLINKPISIDYIEKRIFYIDYYQEESNYTVIDSLYLNGTEGETYFVHLKNITSFYAYRSCLFLSTANAIWKVSPFFEAPFNAPMDIGEIAAVKVVSSDAQSFEADNPCLANNGYCEQFCFAKSDVTCGCADGMELQADGVSCF